MIRTLLDEHATPRCTWRGWDSATVPQGVQQDTSAGHSPRGPGSSLIPRSSLGCLVAPHAMHGSP